MGIFASSSRSACFWIGIGDEGTSNPGFPSPDGSMRFIVRVPSCRSNPRKSWTALPDSLRLVAAFRRACGERSALATGEFRIYQFPTVNSVTTPYTLMVRFCCICGTKIVHAIQNPRIPRCGCRFDLWNPAFRPRTRGPSDLAELLIAR